MIPSPDPASAVAAMRQALAEAGVAPDAVDYVNAHATGTPLGDVLEANALKVVFGDDTSSIPGQLDEEHDRAPSHGRRRDRVCRVPGRLRTPGPAADHQPRRPRPRVRRPLPRPQRSPPAPRRSRRLQLLRIRRQQHEPRASSGVRGRLQSPRPVLPPLGCLENKATAFAKSPKSPTFHQDGCRRGGMTNSSENRGRHDCNHANSAPPIFIGWGEHSDGHDCSFGLGALAAARLPSLPLGPFGLGASAAARLPSLPLGSSENRGRHDCNHANSAPPIFIGWGEHSDGHDCSFGLGALEVASRYSLPLGSSENRGRHDCNHASSAPARPRPFSSGGASIPMVMTVRLVSGRWRLPVVTAYHWVPLKIGADTTAIMQTRPRPFSSGGASIPMVMTVRLVSGRWRPRAFPAYHWVRFARGEGDLVESSRRIDKERGREGEPSSTNTIEEGAEPFQVFLRLWQRHPRHPAS